MNVSTFADLGTLITSERLESDLATIFNFVPPWAADASLADPDPNVAFDENTIVVRVGGQSPDNYYFDVLAFAVLCELTRYGNSVTTNSNHKANERLYLKLTFTTAPEDNMPVWRIVMDAQPREAVKSADDLRDLRAAGLKLIGSGKAIKEARAVALRHAEIAARASGIPDSELSLYLDNIKALFKRHDEVCLVEVK